MTQDRIALAYARNKGYQKGEKYPPSDLGIGLTEHRDHGTATYLGVNAGYLVFQCRCAETVFMAPS